MTAPAATGTASPTREGRLRSWIRLRPTRGAPGPAWLRMTGGALVCLGALEAAVLECFLVPLHLDVVPVPLSVVLAVAGNVAATRLMYRVTAHRAASALPVALWLLVVLFFASRGPGGDLIVPGTAMGLAFLFIGTLAGAFAAGQVLAVSSSRGESSALHPGPPSSRPSAGAGGRPPAPPAGEGNSG